MIKEHLSNGKGLNVAVDSNNARNRMREIPRSGRRDGVMKIAVPDPRAPAEATARWSTKLPLRFRLTAAWTKWVVGVAIGGVLFCVPAYFAVFLVGFLPALLLDFLGVATDSDVVEGVFAVATFGLAYGCAIWVTQKPKMCRQCGCVSARLWE